MRDRLYKKKSILDGVFNTIVPVIIIICLSLFNAPICQADDVADILDDVNKTAVPNTGDTAEEQANSKPVKSKSETSDVTVTNTSMPSDEAVFIGLGVAGLAALAIALGSNSGSDDSAPAAPPPSLVDPVGPSIQGTWSGRLLLINHGSELVTATVIQNGADVQITTSTSLPYGKHFSGTISGSGSMYMFDGTTGETWTTFGGNATANRLSLYDYVNNFEDLDRLELQR